MKIILTGSTGFIGHEVLDQCLHHPSITQIVALSRRDLPSEITREHASKLKVVIVDDWLSYSDKVLNDLKGAEACIWSLGKAFPPDLTVARTVGIEYTLAAARAMTTLFERGNNKKFRFIYLSGGLAERDQKKSLWFMKENRRIRGQVETELLAHATQHAETFTAIIVRPGIVLAKETSVLNLIKALGPNVGIGQLAGVMVQKAVKDVGDKNEAENEVLENKDIKSYALQGIK